MLYVRCFFFVNMFIGNVPLIAACGRSGNEFWGLKLWRCDSFSPTDNVRLLGAIADIGLMDGFLF